VVAVAVAMRDGCAASCCENKMPQPLSLFEDVFGCGEIGLMGVDGGRDGDGGLCQLEFWGRRKILHT